MKNMYATPKEGTYEHKTPNFDGTFRSVIERVAVIGESEKQYLIRLLRPLGTHKSKDEIWVRKHNVRIAMASAMRAVPDYSEAYWNR